MNKSKNDKAWEKIFEKYDLRQRLMSLEKLA